MLTKNFGGIADSRKYASEKIRERNSRFSYAPEKCVFFAKFCISLCYAPKRSNPFLYIPHKNSLLMIKYELSISCRWYFLS